VRILYVASDQCVPGATGGSVHVLEVARGLAARGHDVHAVVKREAGRVERERLCGFTLHRVGWFPPQRYFRFTARTAVRRVAAEVAPEAVMERYYNFGGEGFAVARERGIPALLEVNSPLVDHPGAWKARLDALALVRPLRRYREALVRQAAALVAPIPEIVPAFAHAKLEIVTWGADVEAFQPQRRSAETRRALGVPEGACVALFSGSFRPWHGVHVAEAAARRLAHRADLYFVFVGGPEARAGDGYRGRHLGRVDYARMPELVAAADVGLAPYDTACLAQLELGFYWSPLKIFEYMACGLPTVTIPRFPLTEIVRHGEEGLHAAEADPAALARALETLADDPVLRARLGRSARERVVARYSWARHCEQLESVLARIAA
jgi:glycosyltransferase involved in cell wall biosynthesis